MEVLAFLLIVALLLLAGVTTRRPDKVTHFQKPSEPRPPPSG